MGGGGGAGGGAGPGHPDGCGSSHPPADCAQPEGGGAPHDGWALPQPPVAVPAVNAGDGAAAAKEAGGGGTKADPPLLSPLSLADAGVQAEAG